MSTQKRKLLKNKRTSRALLCPLQAVPEGKARGFCARRGEDQLNLFLVNKKGRLHGYENRCPHMGTPLDWKPDQFLNKENTLIQCSTHGALFQIEDGLCIQGPCSKQSLAKIELEIIDGKVYWMKP